MKKLLSLALLLAPAVLFAQQADESVAAQPARGRRPLARHGCDSHLQ
jgi:hypothetical protein